MFHPRLAVAGAAIVTLLMLGACGASDEDPSTAAADTERVEQTSTEIAAVPPATPATAAGAVPYATAVAPYDAFGTDAKPGVFPRTIRHAMGETTLDKKPVRVVTLDTGELDAMAELGIKPVGAVDYGADGLPKYFAPSEIEGVEVVGTISEPNLEAIARLRPDLILSSKLRHEKIYAQLSSIAPTVFAERPGVTWKQNFTLYSQAVGAEDEAEATEERYEERVAELNEVLPNPRPEVSVVRVMADGQVRLYQRANFLGVLLTDLGFARPAPQNVDDFAAEVSLEQLDQADGDLIIYAVFDATKNTNGAAVTSSALWQQLKAVKADNVKTVDDQTWIGGIGYHAAFDVMDQLEGFVTE